MYREGLTAVHIYDRYVAKMRMSSLAYRHSYVYTYVCIPMYVRKEKLTAGSGEVKMDKNVGRRRETLSPSGEGGWEKEVRGLQCFQTHSLETAFYYSSSGRAPGPVLSHKGPRKSTGGSNR